MIQNTQSKRTILSYIIVSYLLFWLMVLILGGTASMVFDASPTTMRVIANLCAWSPTFALLILFKRIYPNQKVKEVFIDMFRGKLSWKLFLISGFSVIFAMALSIIITSRIESISLKDYVQPSLYTFPIAFLFSLTSGPTGEEAGWRGFLRHPLESKYGFLKGALLSGVIWAFWHTVLWFIDSEFKGLNLLIYVLSNVFVMTSLVIIMHVILKKSNNLLYAIWIHLCFNFIYVYLAVDITFYIIMSIVFIFVAGLYLLYYYRNQGAKNEVVAS